MLYCEIVCPLHAPCALNVDPFCRSKIRKKEDKEEEQQGCEVQWQTIWICNLMILQSDEPEDLLSHILFIYDIDDI